MTSYTGSLLTGRKIALLESRRSAELALLVHELGGVPVSAPAVDEIVSHDDFNVFFDGLAQHRFSVAILLSGTGTAAILDEATRRGRLSETLRALREITIACRGAKPLAVLEQHGLKPRFTTARPHTTHELMRAVSSIDVEGRGIVLVHTGDRNRPVAQDLRRRGARLVEVCPYLSSLPEDVGPITSVVREALADRLDAIIFTNRAQCRHLLQIAAGMRQVGALVRSLNEQMVVGAVGPVCAEELVRAGVTPDVVPDVPSMPSLVHAVADYFQTRDDLWCPPSGGRH